MKAGMDIVKYLGIPHVKGGRNTAEHGGMDCWGLVVLFYENEFGITLPRYETINTVKKDYEKTSTLLQETDCYRNFITIPPSKGHTKDLKYGDIGVFTLAGNPIHTAIILDSKMMLHSDTKESGIERFTDLKWTNRIHSFHRHHSMM